MGSKEKGNERVTANMNSVKISLCFVTVCPEKIKSEAVLEEEE